jgi:choline dehydrogenase-like flavoprotein
MLIDSRELPPDQVIQADVCVIGSGPAGIALARELANTSSRVCILESGGIAPDVKIQDFSSGDVVGDPFLSIQATRNRQFGGNSNIWSIKLGRMADRQWEIGVRYVPLDGVDFEHRDWVPHSGWPIRREDLTPYYEKAQTVAHSGPFTYDVESWFDEQVRTVGFDDPAFMPKIFQFGPRAVFHQTYFQELSATPNVDIYLYATAVELETDSDSSNIRKVRVSNLTGKSYWVEAKAFVLATGGIEVARLMLASNRHQPMGVGNEHDLVGRFFMDHPLLDMGRLQPTSSQVFGQMAFFDMRRVSGHPVMGHLSLTKAAMAEQQVLNSAVVLFPRPSQRQTQAILALKALAEEGYLKSPQPKHWPAIAQHLLKVAGGIDYVLRSAYLAKKYDQSLMHGFGRGGWAEQPQTHTRFKTFEVLLVTEQAPDPSNRVQLSRDCDPLGMPRAELHWKWGQVNIDSARRTQDLFGRAVEQAGLGRFVKHCRDGQPYLSGPAGMAHHIGTTRMSASSTQGVVNENCQVHSVPNLYVASSAVFPTGGYANPTLTVLALSLRLADHLTRTVLADSLVHY